MFKRDLYLQKLTDKKNNHFVKVITGIRRSGKSFLLNEIFKSSLLESGVRPDHIISFGFDLEEDVLLLDDYYKNEPTLIKVGRETRVSSKKFLAYIKDLTKDEDIYYLLLDEIQILDRFVNVLNSFLKHNYDVYVTGSNSRFLSRDVDTEFGGRGDRIHLLPLTFNEYLSDVKMDKRDALDEYIRYGGIPLVQLGNSDEAKVSVAGSILNETYIKDVLERHPQADANVLNDTLKVISSMISTPVNPTKIEKTFNSVYSTKITNDTIASYIEWFEDSYLLNKVERYDVKGRHYIGSPYKVYFEDVGIRNAALNFRDVDETDIIENIVNNELRYRGFNVDVGIVYINEPTDRKDKNGKTIYKETGTEVDFVANKGSKTYYIQVAYRIDSKEKKDQEYKSIRNIPNSFKKIIVVKEEGRHYYTDEGFLRINLLDFLSNADSLDW